MEGAAESAFRAFRAHGRPRDLARVFDLTAQELLVVAGHLARGEEEARERVQQTFLAALEHPERWDPERPLLPWLLGILLRLERREERRRARSRERADHALDVHAGPELDPAAQAADAELAAALHGAIASLPEAYREVLSLRLVHGLEAVEIAHALGRPLETVKTQLKRGKERLREALPRSLAGLLRLEKDGLASMRSAVLAAAQGPATGAALTGAITGGAIVGKTAMVVGAVVLGVGVFLATRGGDERAAAGAVRDEEASVVLVEATEPVVATPASAREALESPAAAPLAAETAELVCRVRYDSDGAPAAGAVVWLWHTGQGRVPVNERAVADETGSARFTELPPGRAIALSDRGTAHDLELAAGANEVELGIPAGVLVTGVVLDGDDRPAQGAEVWLSDQHLQASEGTWLTRAGADGSFALRDVPSGRALAARAAGWAPGEGIRIDGDPGTRVDVTLRVGPAGPRLVGVVRDEHGAPIEDAYLFVGHGIDLRTITRDGVTTVTAPPQTTSSDAAGRFELDAVPSRDVLPVWIAAEGFATAYEEFDLQPEGRPVEIVLSRPARVVGTVRDADGGPLAQAEVSASSVAAPNPPPYRPGPHWGHASAWARPDGSFELEALRPGPATLVARVHALGEVRVEVDLAAGETLVWEARLIPAAALLGTVVDEHGAPLEGLEVTASCEEHPQPHHLGQVLTDADGVFRLSGAVCARYTLRTRELQADLYRPLETAGTAPGTEVRVELSAAQRAGGRFVGRLADEDGTPFDAERVVLTCLGPNGSSWSGGRLSSCAAGELETGSLPPGTYAIAVAVASAASGTWTLGTFELLPGETRDIGAHVHPGTGGLELELVDAAGEPVSRARFALRAEADAMGSLVEFQGGRCVVERLQPGRYVLRSFGSELPMTVAHVEVRAGATTRETVTLPAAFERWMRFPDPTRQGVVECLCSWTCDGEVLLEGRWTFRAPPGAEPRPMHVRLLPRGRHVVVFTSDDGRSATTTFEVGPETTSPEAVVEIAAPFE